MNLNSTIELLSSAKTWIGVDFDGTLVKEGKFPDHGDPVAKMVYRVKKWLNKGEDVRIFTARAADKKQKQYVSDWTKKTFGVRLPVTNKKDHLCKLIVDNIAEHVGENKGNLHAGGPGSGRHPWGRKEKPAPKGKTTNKKGWTVSERRSTLGKQNAVRIAAREQNLAENVIQQLVAKALGGRVYGKDSEPVDVVFKDKKGQLHGVEVKGVLAKKADNARAAQGRLQQIYMGHGAVPKKLLWQAQNKAVALHTVIVDIRKGGLKNPTVYHASRVGSLTFGDDSRAAAQTVKGGLGGLKQVVNGTKR